MGLVVVMVQAMVDKESSQSESTEADTGLGLEQNIHIVTSYTSKDKNHKFDRFFNISDSQHVSHLHSNVAST